MIWFWAQQFTRSRVSLIWVTQFLRYSEDSYFSELLSHGEWTISNSSTQALRLLPWVHALQNSGSIAQATTNWIPQSEQVATKEKRTFGNSFCHSPPLLGKLTETCAFAAGDRSGSISSMWKPQGEWKRAALCLDSSCIGENTDGDQLATKC